MASEHKEQKDLRDKGERCTGVIVYDELPARDLAMALCQRLARRFAGDLEFEFTWWRFKYLRDSEIAGQAALVAVKADLVVLSMQSLGPLLPEIETWFERWMMQRARSQGVLVVLREPKEERDSTSPEYSYFESLAQRANLDYLLLSMPVTELRLADRLREDEVLPNMTGLFPVPDRQYHSSGWGINE